MTKPHVFGDYPSLVGGNAVSFEPPATASRVEVVRNGWGSSSETSVDWWEVRVDGELIARRDWRFFAKRLAGRLAKRYGLERTGRELVWT